jgi:hypothetical protein
MFKIVKYFTNTSNKIAANHELEAFYTSFYVFRSLPYFFTSNNLGFVKTFLQHLECTASLNPLKVNENLKIVL